MPFKPIPGTDEQYGLLSFDASGNERTDDGPGLFSQVLLDQAIKEQPTNIFFFSHGWKGDMPAAIDQYNRWIGAMAKLQADRDLMGPGFKPMWIGLHWPSLPYGEETAAGASFGDLDHGSVKKLVDAAVAHFGGSEALRAPLEIIFQLSVDDAGAIDVPPHVNQAYHQLAGAIGFKAGAGAGAAPDEEGLPLDPQGALEASSATAQFGLGSSIRNGILGGIQQLSFWTMKSRARTVGENGMNRFIAALMTSTNAKIHLMGHSFGCIVTSSILGGKNGRTPLPRPVNSVALIQGAFSLWSYADAGHVPDSAGPGYFNNVIPSQSVSGPFITTQSSFDSAVGIFYPAAVFLDKDASFGVTFPKSGAIGAFGIQGTSAVNGKMLDETGSYAFEGGKIYNLLSDAFIKKMDGSSGAHSDIDGPQVAHAIWQAALASMQMEKANDG